MLKTLRICLLIVFTAAGAARAELPWDFADNTRYVALGDSLAAGYGAFPVTLGYTYLLYHGGAYDKLVNTSFANFAMPGATSKDVLDFQVPQVLAVNDAFPPHVVTLSVGGNDLLALLGPVPPTPEQAGAVIAAFAGNLFNTLAQLCGVPGLRNIYVSNLYDIENFPFDITLIIAAFNQTVDNVVAVANSVCANRIKVADVHAAFSGNQQGLLLINRRGADQFEVHPSNAGYRAMAEAFRAAR